MVEAALCFMGSGSDRTRVDCAVRTMDTWYKGDGLYGDGPVFHWDYYNSFVIHPLLLNVLDVISKSSSAWEASRASALGPGAKICGNSGTAHRAGRNVSRYRQIPLLSFWRVPSACRDGVAAPAAGRSFSPTGSLCPDRRDAPHAFGSRHLRRERLATPGVLRAPAIDR